MIVKYKFEVSRRRHGRKVIEEVPNVSRDVAAGGEKTTAVVIPPVSRKARQLALAYYIERAIEAGLIKDYADAARRIGVSRARVTQTIGILFAPIERLCRILGLD